MGSLSMKDLNHNQRLGRLLGGIFGALGGLLGTILYNAEPPFALKVGALMVSATTVVGAWLGGHLSRRIPPMKSTLAGVLLALADLIVLGLVFALTARTHLPRNPGEFFDAFYFTLICGALPAAVMGLLFGAAFNRWRNNPA
jgi:hypothetical protein